MGEETRLILTAPAASARQAQAAGVSVALMAYRVGTGARLLRSAIPGDWRGGLMAADSAGFSGRGDAAALCRQVVRECVERGYRGVLLDFEGQPDPFLGSVAARLGDLLEARGWTLYVPEAYAGFSQRSVAVIPSALSGGSLRRRLEEAVERFGAERVALGVQRVAEDFTLPAPSGGGKALSREELAQRVRSRGAAVFFSRELCARYFTYLSPAGGAHFVLFDDAGTIREKLKTARELGLRACILAWPEVEDVWREALA